MERFYYEYTQDEKTNKWEDVSKEGIIQILKQHSNSIPLPIIGVIDVGTVMEYTAPTIKFHFLLKRIK